MATRIYSPRFSFVRFSDGHLYDVDWNREQIPGAELGAYLPVNAPSDLAFQLIVEVDDPAVADLLCDVPGTDYGLYIIPGSGLGDPLVYADLVAAIALPGVVKMEAVNLAMGRYRLNPTQIIYYVPGLTAGAFSALPCGCFQLVFVLQFGANVAQAASNVFRYNCDNTDFTSVLDYYSDNDEAGFLYCVAPDIKNRVRLPLYLTRPTYPDEEEVLRLSSGVPTIRKSIVRKLYEVKTDGFPDWLVENLRAVFLHDAVYIEDAPELLQTMPYKGQIVKEGGYDPQYVDYKGYPLAPVAFKVNAVDFRLVKNNCGLCGDYSSLITTTDTGVNVIDPSTIYDVDLLPHVNVDCCDPVKYEVDYYQTNYVQSFTLFSGPAELRIGFGTTATFTPSGSNPPPLFRVKVTCGGVVKFINVFSNQP